MTLNKEQLIRIDAGQNLTLTCSVDSNPIATTIYFEKDGFILNVSNATHSLDLINVSQDKCGIYGCWAENAVGKGYKNVKVIIQRMYF